MMLLILLPVAVLLVFLTFFVFVAHKMTKPERSTGEWTPEDLDLEYEDISFETKDEVPLKGWWIDRGSDKTLICLHGYTSSRWYEVYMRPLLQILKELDYNILYFDFRAHGESGGKRTTIGNKELLDLRAAIDWIEDEKRKKIGLIGYSMGAMIGIKGVVLEDRVDCGIVDSPPLDLDSTSARSLKYFAGLSPIFYRFVKPIALTLFDIAMTDMFRLADDLKKPLLLIGGKNDPLVDISEVEKFYKMVGEENADVKFWKTEADHVRSIQGYPEEYKEEITSFLENNL